MRIRRATIADAPRLAALGQPTQNRHAAEFPTRFRRDPPLETVARAFAAMIEDPSAIWLVAEQHEPVAFLSAEIKQRDESWCARPHHICYLAGIVVAPEYRRQRIAHALLTELKREAQSRKVEAIDLDVWAFNADAKAAFQSLGFGPLAEKMTLPLTSRDAQN